ncbi:MAG: hypothetical protein DI536_31250 [Archangium gephyra]|uniref:Uncharacterized protein n=1 Tax=Archangium gephyra TaxID=48 RepID=A0A2W5T3K9_9BACT|nr:MAG: hypothetical protein DI536_31250 [Archangium gephyra]
MPRVLVVIGEVEAAFGLRLDLDLLEYLQTLTMAERLKRHEAALELIQKLRAAGEKHYGFDPRAVASAADGEG